MPITVLCQRLIDYGLLVGNVVLAQRKPFHSVPEHPRQHHKVRQGLHGAGTNVLPVVVLRETRELLLIVRLVGLEGGWKGGRVREDNIIKARRKTAIDTQDLGLNRILNIYNAIGGRKGSR